MDEVWKSVEGYEGLYEVSNKGRVKSTNLYAHKEPIILSQSTRRDGYKTVNLSKNGTTKPFVVHRLVAKAFIENKENYEMVNHKDENKSNNCVDNLEWCSRSYNQLYSLKLHPERKYVFANNFIDKKTGKNLTPMHEKGARVRTEPIVMISSKGEVLKRYKDYTVARDETGFDLAHIYDVCIRNSANHKTRRKKYISKTRNTIFCFDNEQDIKHTVNKLLDIKAP